MMEVKIFYASLISIIRPPVQSNDASYDLHKFFHASSSKELICCSWLREKIGEILAQSKHP